jgi:hypothetical protein
MVALALLFSLLSRTKHTNMGIKVDDADRPPMREGGSQSRKRRCVVTTKRDNPGRGINRRICRAM